MFRLFSSFISFIFLVWLLPLGIFIAPSMEKLLCDGQRAFCMCTSIKPEAGAKVAHSADSIKSESGVQKEQRASGGANYLLFASQESFELAYLKIPATDMIKNFYSDPFLLSLEHVPKV